MKKPFTTCIRGLICLAVLGVWVSTALAVNPATISVTVTIQNLSVSASGPIAYGTVLAGSVTVSTDSSHVVNNGNVPETYSLKLTDPVGWTAVQDVPGSEQYCLSAIFNSADPLGGDFVYATHALSTSSVACSDTKFAGDQTGVSVATSEARGLWFKFEAPSSTVVTTPQTIVVTVTAAAAS